MQSGQHVSHGEKCSKLNLQNPGFGTATCRCTADYWRQTPVVDTNAAPDVDKSIATDARCSDAVDGGPAISVSLSAAPQFPGAFESKEAQVRSYQLSSPYARIC